jgi:hypothetical protein
LAAGLRLRARWWRSTHGGCACLRGCRGDPDNLRPGQWVARHLGELPTGRTVVDVGTSSAAARLVGLDLG